MNLSFALCTFSSSAASLYRIASLSTAQISGLLYQKFWRMNSLHSRGPSSSEIPNALPPCFRNAEISSLVMIWRMRLGRNPATCLIGSVSAMKISTSFDRNGTLILKVAVAQDCLCRQFCMAIKRFRPLPVPNLVHPVNFSYNASHFGDPCRRIYILRRFKLFEDRRVRFWSAVHKIDADQVDVDLWNEGE